MISCPRCYSAVGGYCYGGERGESGPFYYCPDCGYSEEDDRISEHRRRRELDKTPTDEHRCLPDGAPVVASYPERRRP